MSTWIDVASKSIQFYETSALSELMIEPTLYGDTSLSQNKHASQETGPLSLASFTQRMFWLMEQLEPETPAYNLPRVLLIKGPLGIAQLNQSFSLILRRHEVLRTRFVEQDGDLLQEVLDLPSLPLPVVDLTHLHELERRTELQSLALAEGRRSFNLNQAPLLRLLLLRLQPDEHVLIMVFHHIIADGWSMSIIFDELAEFYDSCRSGRAPNLPQLPFSYADFARWQHEHLTEQTLALARAYWQEKLRSCPELLEIPSDYPRPAVQSHHGALHSIVIPAPLTARLKQVCERQRATLFMGLLAVFQILLHRYSGAEDILVGTPVANRDDPDLTHIVGCFVNTIVMRTKLSGDPAFVEALQRVREVALEGYAHQELPFEQLLVQLKPQRNASQTPLFQTMLILHNAPRQNARIAGLELEEIEFDNGVAKFDLTLDVVEQDGCLYCVFEYNTDLFITSTIERLAQHFVVLLTAAMEAPTTPISHLPLLDKSEQHRVLVEWNQTAADYPRNLRIDTAFEAQARRTPGGVALIEGDHRITFADLNWRADRVAQELACRRFPVDTPIGVYLDRSADAFAAIIGILKAGHPYVPLDLAQPKIRLHRLVTDCGCPLVLTKRALFHALPPTIEAVFLDAGSTIWDPIKNAPARAAAGSDVAYLIYTSGSTGHPKGVMGTHSATINRCEWMYHTYPFRNDEVCCQKTSLGFVDSIWEMFGPLLRGVPNIIIANDDVLDPERLITLLAKATVTRIVMVPTLLRVLLEHAPNLGSILPHLRIWTVSGEFLSNELAQQFKVACPDAVLLNLYGSSEVAGDVTWHEVTDLRQKMPVPIGRPISNVKVYILDEHLQPVPIGIPGQIVVGGACLATGYWRQPDLNRERFLQNPFDPGGSQLFATGDLGRLLSDGAIEYLGRKDGQVKLRGYRIELGDIESHLLQHPDVSQATLSVAVNKGDQSSQLVAHVVGRFGRRPLAEELRAFLRDRLPQYMVPAVFVYLNELPLLPSGKVNRSALLEPPRTEMSDHDTIQPGGDTESAVAAIWRELLHIPEITVHQNFFNLGGHSLLAMQVLARIRRRFGVDVPLRELFDKPTIQGIAQAIGRARANDITPSPRPIRPRPRPRPVIDTETLVTELGKLSPEQIELLLRQVRKS